MLSLPNYKIEQHVGIMFIGICIDSAWRCNIRPGYTSAFYVIVIIMCQQYAFP